MKNCRIAENQGGDCQAIIDKWKKVSDELSDQLDETLKDDPASVLAWDKELAECGLDMASRPAWMNNIPGAAGMSDEQARAYVQQWNSQDLSKTLDTQTTAKLANPNQVYNSIKVNIDAAAKFDSYTLSRKSIDSSMISNREIQLAVPANTTKTQWTEINRAIEYDKSQGVTVKVTQVK